MKEKIINRVKKLNMVTMLMIPIILSRLLSFLYGAHGCNIWEYEKNMIPVAAGILFVFCFNVELKGIDKKRASLILLVANAIPAAYSLVLYICKSGLYFDDDRKAGVLTWFCAIAVIILELCCYLCIYNHYRKDNATDYAHIKGLPVCAGFAMFFVLIRNLGIEIDSAVDELNFVGVILSSIAPMIPLLCLMIMGFEGIRRPIEECDISTVKTVLIAVIVIIVGVTIGTVGDCGAACTDSSEYPGGYMECYKCDGAGLVNEGFFDLETCPVCRGSGMVHGNGN